MAWTKSPIDVSKLVLNDGRGLRPSPEMEAILRRLGFIQRSEFGGLSTRPSAGDARVKVGNGDDATGPAGDTAL